MLESDSEGFLIGEVITEIKRSEKLLGIIKDDIAQIRSAILGSNRSSMASKPSSDTKIKLSEKSSVSATPNNKRNSTPDNSVVKSINKLQKSIVPSKTRNRDSKGRFVSANSHTSGAGNNGRDNQRKFIDGTNENRFINNLPGKVSGVIKSSQAIEGIDPTIKAINEVVQPMQRGYQAVFSGDIEKKKFNWFGKIFKELSVVACKHNP